MTESMERKLAAILSADAVGYSRLMRGDDEGTVRTLESHRRTIERIVGTFRGRVVDSPGDNLLAELPSATGAVRCALEIQAALGSLNRTLPEDRRMHFRIGIHLGEVIVQDQRLYGDGVNVTARLEALAPPGGLCMSDLVYQQVRQKLDLAVTDLGEQALKNIEQPVRAFSVGGEGDAPPRVAARSIAARPLALSPPSKPSLAVLPFFNLNGDPGQEYFSEGLTIDIMGELVRIPGLFLIGTDSMLTYRDTGAKPRSVASELGVRHVLEGSVRRDERRVRVNARLVEGESGRHIWAERYDRELVDVFAVQDEITDSVVTALDVQLVGGGDAQTMRKHLRDPQALGLVYRGVERLHRFTRNDMAEARRLFEEAIERAPDSPIPYAQSAWTHYFDVERGWSDEPLESLQRMEQRSLQSLERGDVSGFAHLMLSHLHLVRREYDEALELADRALEERPSCQGSWGLKANILNYAGRPAEAVPLAEESLRLSPVAQPFVPEVLAMAHYLCGQLEDALATANDMIALAPDSLDARMVLAAALVESDRAQAAQEAAREILAHDPRFSLSLLSATRPFRDASALERLVDALRKAGIPEGETPPGLAAPHAASRRRVAARPRRV